LGANADSGGGRGAAELIDLLHLGRERVIGSWLVGDVLIDPGPSVCVPELLRALAGREPRVLALTHIHLDHGGAAGTLARRFPAAEVWVHERGARHLVDPEKLLASATRLYGERMDELWGEVLPVPAERLRVLGGGEQIGPWRVSYTPGHASHHVSYLHESSGDAFVGDVAGVRIGSGPVLAPTPPPDIDLAAWERSLADIERWRPRRLVPTHFGVYEDVAAHVAALRRELARAQEAATALDEAAFTTALRAQIEASSADAAVAASYAQALPPDQSYAGLVRWLHAPLSGALGDALRPSDE
jgi:glyoxylase-like metal-dependent hydrolase (beta-lactamase superfamily II)